MRKERAWQWGRDIGLFALGALAGSAALMALARPTDRIIAQWKNPPYVTYDGGPYYLSVVEGGWDWRVFPFQWKRGYALVMGPTMKPRSGDRRVDFTFYPPTALANDLPAFIRTAHVEWASDGVTVAPANGQLVFLPAWMFVRQNAAGAAQ